MLPANGGCDHDPDPVDSSLIFARPSLNLMRHGARLHEADQDSRLVHLGLGLKVLAWLQPVSISRCGTSSSPRSIYIQPSSSKPLPTKASAPGQKSFAEVLLEGLAKPVGSVAAQAGMVSNGSGGARPTATVQGAGLWLEAWPHRPGRLALEVLDLASQLGLFQWF